MIWESRTSTAPNNAATRPLKERLRGQSRSYLNDIWLKNSRKDLTFCKLLIDEVIDELKALPESPLDHQLIEFDAKIEYAAKRLQSAKSDHPDESEFLATEATHWQKLGENEKALKSLEKAAQIRPRNASVFSRLASILKKYKSPADAIEVLRRGLEKFPSDKALHQKIAIELLDQSDDVDPSVEYHLKLSFSSGDHNFDGRFLLAEFYFLAGKIPESVALFAEIDSKAPVNFRTRSPNVDDRPATSACTNVIC